MGIVVSLMSLALAAGTVGATAPAPSFADLGRHAQYREVKLSPDGEYLAASAHIGDDSVLALLRLSDRKAVTLRAPNGTELAGIEWAGPRRVLYTIGEKLGGFVQPQPTGEIYAVNADGEGGKILFGMRAGDEVGSRIKRATTRYAAAYPIDAQPDGAGRVLIATYNGASNAGYYAEIERLDVNTGKTTRVTTSPMRNAAFLTDGRGVVRFAYGAGNDMGWQVWYRADDSGKWDLLFDEPRDEKRLAPLAFARGDGAVYFSCPGEHGIGGLCRWDVATRAMTTLWSGKESGLLGTVPSFDGKDVVAVRSMPGRVATVLLDKQAPEAQLLVSTMQQFPGEDVDIVSSSRDGRKAVVLVHSDINAGRYYLYDAQSRQLTFLLDRAAWLKPDAMAEMEPIALTSRDGLSLHGYLTRPPGQEKARNLPMVVFVHGGPYGVRDEWGFDPNVQAMATRGYAVLQVNFRGSGSYGQSFVRAGYREWGGKMQDDVTDATHWAIEQGIADPKRICIYGGSYGGYAALMGAIREPDLYRCTIGSFGVYDLRLMASRGDIPQQVSGANYLKLVLGSDDDDLARRSPINQLDRLKAKAMLVVGGQDQRVPPIHGENLRAAMRKRGIEPEWLYERTEGHGFYDEAHRAELFERVDAFLKANIGTSSPSQ